MIKYLDIPLVKILPNKPTLNSQSGSAYIETAQYIRQNWLYKKNKAEFETKITVHFSSHNAGYMHENVTPIDLIEELINNISDPDLRSGSLLLLAEIARCQTIFSDQLEQQKVIDEIAKLDWKTMATDNAESAFTIVACLIFKDKETHSQFPIKKFQDQAKVYIEQLLTHLKDVTISSTNQNLITPILASSYVLISSLNDDEKWQPALVNYLLKHKKILSSLIANTQQTHETLTQLLATKIYCLLATLSPVNPHKHKIYFPPLVEQLRTLCASSDRYLAAAGKEIIFTIARTDDIENQTGYLENRANITIIKPLNIIKALIIAHQDADNSPAKISCVSKIAQIVTKYPELKEQLFTEEHLNLLLSQYDASEDYPRLMQLMEFGLEDNSYLTILGSCNVVELLFNIVQRNQSTNMRKRAYHLLHIVMKYFGMEPSFEKPVFTDELIKLLKTIKNNFVEKTSLEQGKLNFDLYLDALDILSINLGGKQEKVYATLTSCSSRMYTTPKVQSFVGIANNLKMYFDEEHVAGDGNCAFTAIEKSRIEVSSMLLSLSNNETIRERFIPIILEAIMTKVWQPQNQSELQQRLDAYHRQINTVDTLMANLSDKLMLNNLPENREDKIKQRIKELGSSNSLNQAYTMETALQSQLKNRLSNKEIYEDYFREMANETSGLWLDLESIKVFAETTQMNLCVWQKSGSEQPNEIAIRVEVGDISAADTKHIIFTGNHFNILNVTSTENIASLAISR